MDNKNTDDNLLQRVLELLRNNDHVDIQVNTLDDEENSDNEESILLEIISSLACSQEKLCSILQRYMNNRTNN